MVSRSYNETVLREMVWEFEVLGYLRIENALNVEQIGRFNAAVDRHLEAYPEDWID